MRITISSPDGLGDFILRVPMIRALLAAGHELQLLLRRPAADLAATVFPEVERLEIAADPYHAETRCKKNPFLKEQLAIEKFRPDLYVASLFALNFFDEVWFEHDQWKVPVAGFSTSDAFWPSGTIADPVTLAEVFRINVQVPVALPELEKNRLLGSAILGRDLPHESPRLEPGEEALAMAREILQRHGLREGEYWIACVGSRSGIVMKDWGGENWRAFFADVIPRGKRPVVFLGNPKEWESIERIRNANFPSINLASDPPPIPVSLALASLSCGYVGRDSGVMHLVAATDRPVLATFGGGHWGRFLPGARAVAVTYSVPCRGCDFACAFDRPYCIRDIGLPLMVRAWQRLPSVGRNVEIFEEESLPDVEFSIAGVPGGFAFRKKLGIRKMESAGRGSIFERIFPRKE